MGCSFGRCGVGPLPAGSGLQVGIGGGEWLVDGLPVGWVVWVWVRMVWHVLVCGEWVYHRDRGFVQHW